MLHVSPGTLPWSRSRGAHQSQHSAASYKPRHTRKRLLPSRSYLACKAQMKVPLIHAHINNVMNVSTDQFSHAEHQCHAMHECYARHRSRAVGCQLLATIWHHATSQAMCNACACTCLLHGHRRHQHNQCVCKVRLPTHLLCPLSISPHTHVAAGATQHLKSHNATACTTSHSNHPSCSLQLSCSSEPHAGTAAAAADGWAHTQSYSTLNCDQKHTQQRKSSKQWAVC